MMLPQTNDLQPSTIASINAKTRREKRRFGCLQHFVFKDNWFISNLIMLFTFWREYFGISFYKHVLYILANKM